jgi:hypothetical protein
MFEQGKSISVIDRWSQMFTPMWTGKYNHLRRNSCLLIPEICRTAFRWLWFFSGAQFNVELTCAAGPWKAAMQRGEWVLAIFNNLASHILCSSQIFAADGSSEDPTWNSEKCKIRILRQYGGHSLRFDHQQKTMRISHDTNENNGKWRVR